MNTQELLLRTAEDLNTSERRRLKAEAELAEAKRRLEEGVLEKGGLVDKLMQEINKRLDGWLIITYLAARLKETPEGCNYVFQQNVIFANNSGQFSRFFNIFILCPKLSAKSN